MNTYTIEGYPVAWSRTRTNGKRHYHAPKYANWKAAAQLELRSQSQELYDGPIAVRVMICLPVPKSWPKYKRQQAIGNQFYPTGKPDLDNYAKAVFDAGNGIVWSDDAIIVSAQVDKVYSDNPHVWILVRKLY